MNERTEKIKELTAQLASLIREAGIEKDETRELYCFVLKRLPRTVLVDRKCRDEDCFFQGVSNLFSQAEFHLLNQTEKHDLRIAFSYLKNGEAKISIGFYDEPEIYRGTWLEATEFILKKIEESSVFPTLSFKKRDSLKFAMDIFKSKTL